MGWEFVDELVFQDVPGRRFSLVSSSLRHIKTLLLYQWGLRIASAVQHRKDLESVGIIDVDFSRPSKSLLPSERGLLGQLVSGRHFTRDARSKFAGTNCSDECPHCKKSVDSRAHRVFDCPAFERVRWHYRDIFMVCGPSRQAWVSRCAVPYKVCFFTDGSCLFPAVPDIRVAAAAVVKPAGSGVFEPVWSGLLPTSNQTIQRAEVLAGAIATASALNPVVISGSLYFVSIARRLLSCWDSGSLPRFPAENHDLWEFF